MPNCIRDKRTGALKFFQTPDEKNIGKLKKDNKLLLEKLTTLESELNKIKKQLNQNDKK